MNIATTAFPSLSQSQAESVATNLTASMSTQTAVLTNGGSTAAQVAAAQAASWPLLAQVYLLTTAAANGNMLTHSQRPAWLGMLTGAQSLEAALGSTIRELSGADIQTAMRALTTASIGSNGR